tara:strand:- start:693 stop:833 length:141 start_codon:yes stop_codon:yes gene_type:complete
MQKMCAQWVSEYLPTQTSLQKKKIENFNGSKIEKKEKEIDLFQLNI